MQHRFSATVLIAFLWLLPLTGGENTSPVNPVEFSRHTDSRSGISYYLPATWNIRYNDLGNRSIHRVLHKDHSSITIISTRADIQSIEKWKRWKEWFGKKPYVILDKGKLVPENNSERLLVIQYRQGGKTWLERIRINLEGSWLISVSCRSPLKKFREHTRVFNTVMGSISQEKPEGK